MLSEYRDYDRRIFRALALVNGGSVSGHQRVEFAKFIGDGSTIEARFEHTLGGIDIIDHTNVTVVDLLVVVVFNLHDFVAWSERPAEPFDLALAGRIKRGLQ